MKESSKLLVGLVFSCIMSFLISGVLFLFDLEIYIRLAFILHFLVWQMVFGVLFYVYTSLLMEGRK